MQQLVLLLPLLPQAGITLVEVVAVAVPAAVAATMAAEVTAAAGSSSCCLSHHNRTDPAGDLHWKYLVRMCTRCRWVGGMSVLGTVLSQLCYGGVQLLYTSRGFKW